MSLDFFLGFILGFAFGFVFCIFNFNLYPTPQKKEDKEKDPANWWKYGKDPFDYNEFEEM